MSGEHCPGATVGKELTVGCIIENHEGQVSAELLIVGFNGAVDGGNEIERFHT